MIYTTRRKHLALPVHPRSRQRRQRDRVEAARCLLLAQSVHQSAPAIALSIGSGMAEKNTLSGS